MAYLLQIACTTLLAEILLRFVTVPSAGFRYAYWRLVLAASLVLPWLLRPLADPAVVAPVRAAGDPMAATAVGTLESAVPHWTASSGWLSSSLLWIAIAGTALRLLWVAVAIARLHHLRREAVPLHDTVFDDLQEALGTDATLMTAGRVVQPVTFGRVRPVVLVPAGLTASAESVRRAVLAHELVHVQRGDWMWTLVEEAVRSLLWFHPAVWWMLLRVQQTREEYTDHLAVLTTGNRQAYMEALVTFADVSRLDPAPAFARRAHLFHRILLLSARKELVMSSRRLVASGAMLFAVLSVGAFYSSEAFPLPPWSSTALQAAPAPAGQAVQTPRPITPENPIPRRTFATPVEYPFQLRGTGYEGVVGLRVVLGASGSVVDVAAGSGALFNRNVAENERQRAIEAFMTATADALRRWTYDPPAEPPIAFFVAATFRAGQAATIVQGEREQVRVVGAPGGARGGGPVVVLPGTGADTAAGGAPLQAMLEAQRAILETERSLETLRRETERQGGGAPAQSPRAPVRVGGQLPAKTTHVDPVYPPIARSARVAGTVILELTIDEQGRVADVRVLRSIPLLDRAAIDAARQWEYTPVLLNGQPVPAVFTATVPFPPEF